MSMTNTKRSTSQSVMDEDRGDPLGLIRLEFWKEFSHKQADANAQGWPPSSPSPYAIQHIPGSSMQPIFAIKDLRTWYGASYIESHYIVSPSVKDR